jgi:hypothetical protein
MNRQTERAVMPDTHLYRSSTSSRRALGTGGYLQDANVRCDSALFTQPMGAAVC